MAYGGAQTVTVSLNADAAAILENECRIRMQGSGMEHSEGMPSMLAIWTYSTGVKLTARERKWAGGSHCWKPLRMFCKVDIPRFPKHIAEGRKCPQFQSSLNSHSRR